MRHRQRPYQSRRPSPALRTAAAVAVAVPVLALAPAAQASPEDTPGEPGQPNLVVSELPETPLELGETKHTSVTLTNQGTTPVDGIVFRVRLTRGLEFPESARGCTYTTTGDQIRQSLCRLDITLEPGASTTVPIPFKVLPKALMEVVEYGVSDVSGGDFERYHRTSLRANSTADFAAVGDRAKGHAGHTVTVRASMRNDGPGWVKNTVSDDQPALMVNIPEGTVAVRVPEDCKPFEIDGPTGPSEPGKPQYVCYPPDYTFDVGSVHSYTFKLLIKRGTHSTSGEVKATSAYGIHPEFDHNTANDKATISVSVHGHRSEVSSADQGSGSGAGSASGSTADHGTDDTHSSTAAGDAQTGPTKPSKVDLVSTASHAGQGTSTGGSILPYAAAGAVAAAGLGGLAVLAVRRRRAHSS